MPKPNNNNDNLKDKGANLNIMDVDLSTGQDPFSNLQPKSYPLYPLSSL